jgi:hypothetical protein
MGINVLVRPLEFCAYCGDIANTRDHVVPRAYASRVPTRCRRGGSDPGETVPACHRCNSTLGSRLFRSFEARRGYVRARLGLSGPYIEPIAPEAGTEPIAPVAEAAVSVVTTPDDAAGSFTTLVWRRARGPGRYTYVPRPVEAEAFRATHALAVGAVECAVCATPFTRKMDWQEYCSPRCRRRAQTLRKIARSVSR